MLKEATESTVITIAGLALTRPAARGALCSEARAGIGW